MPAVIPLEPTGSNVTLFSATQDQLELPSNIGVAAAAFAFLLILRLALRSRSKESSSERVPGLADPGVLLQRHYFPPVWEKSRGVSNGLVTVMSAAVQEKVDVQDEQRSSEDKPTMRLDEDKDEHEHHGDEYRVSGTTMDIGQRLKLRPALPPPMTPPTLSTRIFAFEDRLPNSAVSTAGDMDNTFFQQPNPDYTSSSSSSSTMLHNNSSDSPITPRRRSYSKTLPLGPPLPVSILEEDGSVTPLSPSSFPSSSPILPLAPHEAFHHDEINVKGEIISVIDDSGAGWKRHTRVYGGGVCLACLAASGEGREGGFYGDRVRPEEKRQ